jgi:hypothetical protein
VILPDVGITVQTGDEARATFFPAIAFAHEVVELGRRRGLRPYQIALAAVAIAESCWIGYGWGFNILRSAVLQAYSFPAPAIVHAIAHGEALCGMPGRPAEWPPNHMHVSAFQLGERSKITCEKCRARAASIQPGSAT